MSKLPGKVAWYEIVTPDAQATTRFYSEVLGWKVQNADMGGEHPYTMFHAPEHQPQCGIAGWPPLEGRSHWVGYVSVPDTDAAIETVKAHGGQIMSDTVDMPTVGKMTPVTDPQGAAFFLFEGADDDAPDAPSQPGQFHWFELMTSDAEAAVPFYEAVFGYQTDSMDMPTGRYHVFSRDGQHRAGAMSLPEEAKGAPPAWLPYVNVADVDAALARAQKNGGTVCVPAMDVPMVGRLGQIIDPNGAWLGLITPAEMPQS